MKIELFNQAIQSIASNHANSNFKKFAESFAVIFSDESLDHLFKMTKMTLLFEGYYNSVETESTLKAELLIIRQECWANHFGTPTLAFLITHQEQIDKISQYFKEINETSEPLRIDIAFQLQLDKENDVAVDVNAVSRVEIPLQQEATGTFIKTHNPTGGFTTTPCDLYSQQFIDYAASVAKDGGVVLEIGAAFGAASLQALAKGATVYCNDIEPQNLAVIRNRYLKNGSDLSDSITGDDKKLIIVPGSFPDELSGLPKGFFDAILICRVLHFFPGYKIEQALKLMGTLLKSAGKLFVVCETPFLKNWQRFIPEHEKRLNEGKEWPGEITNPVDFESSGMAATLPKFVHWITKEVLDRSFKKIGFFEIEQSSYIDRQGQFPADLLLDGKESVGAIAIKK